MGKLQDGPMGSGAGLMSRPNKLGFNDEVYEGQIEPLGRYIEVHTFGNTTQYYFMCPGCKALHAPSNSWTFNGDPDRPTFSPSILVRGVNDLGAPERCHSFVRDGKIQFLPDCTHELRGMTVPMERLDVDY